MKPLGPIRPTDDQARALARRLIDAATHAALGTLPPGADFPLVTRIALATDPEGRPMTLVSSLSAHSTALRARPECGLLLGEPGDKGDPLTHPRLTLRARARFVPRDSDQHTGLRAHYLRLRPKAGLYADFADFAFVVFQAEGASLNGGFGKAFELTAEDLTRP